VDLTALPQKYRLADLKIRAKTVAAYRDALRIIVQTLPEFRDASIQEEHAQVELLLSQADQSLFGPLNAQLRQILT
jgi:hypothetical protein